MRTTMQCRGGNVGALAERLLAPFRPKPGSR